MTETKGPVLIELDTKPTISPSDAPAIVDPVELSGHSAMQTVAKFAARPPSRLARWFWGVLLTLFGFLVTVAAWDVVVGLMARSPVLGGIALGLIALFGLILLLIAVREWAAFARLARIDGIKQAADSALAQDDLAAAHLVGDKLAQLYSARADCEWGLQRMSERKTEVFDADGLISLADSEVMTTLDAATTAEIESAVRQVATVTAIVPLAFADVIIALTANLRMIRRIAEIYGGRSGTLGSWRLARSVLTHLVATGAVAVGDDLIGSIAGGGIVSKFSRRFGEGVINGALTARVGVAAIEVCRPLPFRTNLRPSIAGLVTRALTGMFGSAK